MQELLDKIKDLSKFFIQFFSSLYNTVLKHNLVKKI